MNYYVIQFKSILESLDSSSGIIEKESHDLVNMFIEDDNLIEDFLSLFEYYFKSTKYKVQFFLLMNDILQRLNKINNYDNSIVSGLKKRIFKTIKDLIPIICNYGEKIKFEFNKILNIWIEKKVFSRESVNELKIILIDNLDEPLKSFDNPTFKNLLNRGKVKIPHKIMEYLGFYENFDKYGIKAEKAKKDNFEDEYSKFIVLENKYRENLLKNSLDLLKKNVNIYHKHVELLSEVDNLLGKINLIKNN